MIDVAIVAPVVGDSEENYTKEMIVDEIKKFVPSAVVVKVQPNRPDTRNYRVDFSRIHNEMNFVISRKVNDGVREIRKLIISNILADPFDIKYENA